MNSLEDMSATPANMRFVTWIGMSCSPTTYQVPDTTQYQIYRGHTLVVDISATKRESLEVFLKCLERVALADGHGLPHIESLMIRLTHPDVHQESGLWAALRNLHPQQLNIILAKACPSLTEPMLPGLPRGAFGERMLSTALGAIECMEQSHLFSRVKTLNIQHPSALETFAAMCEDIPALYTHLEVLVLRAPPWTKTMRQPPGIKFFAALSRCTTVKSLFLAAAEEDVDKNFCHMLPSFLPPNIISLRISGPLIMAEYAGWHWVRFAADKSWLPMLREFSCTLTPEGMPVDGNRGVTNKAAEWARIFREEMLEDRTTSKH
ncbi:hypothetical protein H0H81_000826 [Sphagnurus paluster]|uniref:Uncharacterized protein n=1 Tax=Sphagnurus paluster TaxID=117069 RepID=A0A9P7FW69_9AGAR|nr:hypothetical protein H0H81_000826 [Sphagnurus paluster]